MILLNVQQVHKSFGVTTILDQINMTISEKDRVGLVGKNGAGKSTLLKIITGELLPDAGTITLAKNRRIDYLAQDSGLNSERTIWDEMLTVFHRLIDMEGELRQLESRMGEPEYINDANKYEKLMDEYAGLSHRFQEEGGFSYQAQIRSLLTGLGFSEAVWQQSINSLSGGQKTRLAMVKLLLTKPDLLILDEPTNYLDIATLTWLESYLVGYDGAILVVSHDRYFLDRIVTTIYEIEFQQIKRYTGNYSSYQRQKQEDLLQAEKQYQKQQVEIKKLEEFVQKNLVRASTTKRAQSRRKVLEKMDRLDRPNTENRLKPLNFMIDKMTGNDVLNVSDLTIGYSDKTISSHLSFRIERGDRVALVGPNGVGKSTLLKTLLKEIPPISGLFSWGSQVQLGYYDQEQTGLDENKRVIDIIWDAYPMMPELEIRSLLGRFLFSGEEVEKPVSVLSGGEKARLSLAKLMLTRANVLLLDEPTNHLDLYSKEVLEQALLEYPGTLLFISHDRYFLNRISTMTLELSNHGITSYLGNYDYYLEKKDELVDTPTLTTATAQAKTINEVFTDQSATPNFQQMKEAKRNQRKLERELQDVENKIATNEAEIAQLELESANPEVYQDYEQTLAITTRIQQLKDELDQLLIDWEQLTTELEQE